MYLMSVILEKTCSTLLWVESSGSVGNVFRKNRVARKHTEDIELDVCLSVVEAGKTSVRTISKSKQEINRESVRKILLKNKFKPYKPKLINTLQDRDFDIRLLFSFWYQGKIEEDYKFPYNILWTDEATFTSNGVVSSQNSRWWAQGNPNFIIECRNQYSFKTNVWCGILNDQIIGPYFFRNNLNSQRYLEFLNNDIAEVLDNMAIDLRCALWYQLDGAPIHNTLQVRNTLNVLFHSRVIGRNWDNCWPPRSPDITPLDFFLCGYLKQKVYKFRPFRDIDHLETIIRQCVQEIPPQFVKKAVKEVSRRTIRCIERNGGHTEM